MVSMRTSKVPAPLSLAASLFLPGALAQNSTNTTTPVCYTSTERATKANSTGQYEFNWDNPYATDDPWYVSVVVGPDRTSPEDFSGSTFISVPKDVSNGTEICIYQFNNINATLSNGENSCSGAISTACVEFLNDALDKSDGISCPNHSSDRDAFEKACPMLGGDSVRSTQYIDVTEDACAFDDVPGVQVPDDYITFGAVSYRYGPYKDTKMGSKPEQTYDLLTRQAVPLVLLGSFVDRQSMRLQRNTEVICVVANNTVEGSRTAKEEEPWKSAAVRASAGGVTWVAAAVVAAVVVAL